MCPGTNSRDQLTSDVVEKIERMYDEVSRFGSLLLFCFDYSGNAEAWHEIDAAFCPEVITKVAHLPSLT